MIVKDPLQIKTHPIFYQLPNYCNTKDLYLKIEGLNIAGSIKLKSAESMIYALEAQSNIYLKSKILICSSSGSLAVALSIICKVKGYNLLCVSDPNMNKKSRDLIQVYGAKLHLVNSKDSNGGYLGSRISFIKKLLKESEQYLWLNQYANIDSKKAHYFTTAKEIHVELGHITHLFVGAGTTGTLMGCAEYFKENLPHVKIIAVDASGSVTFGYPPGRRLIPGLGTSRKPELLDENLVDFVMQISEIDTINACHYLLEEEGLFVGGSTGTVLAAIKQYGLKQNAVAVGISPDFGNNYIDTVYNLNWVKKNYNREE